LREARVLRKVVQNLKYVFIPGLLTMVVLLTAACGDRAIPVQSPSMVSQEATPTAHPQTDNGPRPQYIQDDTVKFERISVEQGLSQSSVRSIFQDSKGFLWFGTNDGLNKYDGYDFTVYRHNPEDPHSLCNNTILALYEDHSGMLWIGTEDGLDKFDRDTEQFTHYRNIPDDLGSLSGSQIRAIYEDRSGVLWVGTWGGGLNRFDRESERFTHYQYSLYDDDSLGSDVVEVIYQDRSGVLWVGTRGGGLDRFDRERQQFVHYVHDPDDPYSLSHNTVVAIYEDQAGVLWIGTDGGGLDGFYRSSEQFFHYPHNPTDPHSLSYPIVTSISEDQSGELWVGTWGGGLDRFDREKKQFVHYPSNPDDPYSLGSNVIESMYKDRSGVLWVGTYGGGLSKLDPETEKFTHYRTVPRDPNSLSDDMVWSLLKDEAGMLWIGTASGGLNKLDRATGQFTFYRNDPNDPHSLSDNMVSALHQDRTGTLWVGTGGKGLDRFDRENEQFIHYPHDPDDACSLSDNTVIAIYEDHSGVLWIGTYGGGLDRYDRSTDCFIHYPHDPRDPHSLSHNTVWSIYQDRAGVLWVGTRGGGLNRFERETEQFTSYQNDPDIPNSLSDDLVYAIHEDQSGMLWIGTGGGGLNRFDRETEQFTHYRYKEKNGLPNDVIYGILEDEKGFLWLSTNNGLSKFDPRTETFKNYDASDGLQSNEFNGGAYYQSSDGEMFFGGVNGFNAFYPDQIEDNPYVPPVVLTSLTQGGQDVDVGKAAENVTEATFHWPNNFFEFEFAALSYSQPGENQYAYMLEGLEDWVYVGTRRFGRYTNLPGGTYTLKIKGSNNDRVWNEKGASVTLTIVPPFWGTWWFRAVVALIVVGGVIGGYRLRVRSIETRSRELENQVRERTAELLRTNELLKQEILERERAEEALAQQAAEVAVAAERSRLARDLHDAVTQTLFSASLIAEALPNVWANDRDEGEQLLAEIRRLSRGALAEMRTLLLELRPAALVETSLGELLHQLAEAVTGRTGVPVTVAVEGQCELSSDVHVALYRIAQEALNNVVKHACAEHVAVSLCCVPLPVSQRRRLLAEGRKGRMVKLRIRDDGCGFDLGEVLPDHMGLGIMHERAQAIGATLEIESEPGLGTQVVVIWKEDER
jgi:ligand-binding sensor domain-containing protein/signal transduction histidine kinase